MFLFCQDCADGSDEVNCTDVIDNASAKPILPVPIFPKGNNIYFCIFYNDILQNFVIKKLNGNIMLKVLLKSSQLILKNVKKHYGTSNTLMQKMFIFETLTCDYQYFDIHHYISNINRFIPLQKP